MRVPIAIVDDKPSHRAVRCHRACVPVPTGSTGRLLAGEHDARIQATGDQFGGDLGQAGGAGPAIAAQRLERLAHVETAGDRRAGRQG